MATPSRMPLLTLGWQSWSVLVVVLIVVLLAATYFVVQ